MSDPAAGTGAQLAELSSQVVELARAMASLEQRVARLEAGAGPASTPAPTGPTPTPSAPTAAADRGRAAEAFGTVTVLSALGRLCLVLCGGFLLRALTTTGAVPETAGVVIGLAYAALWLVLAHRSTATGRTTAGIIHGLAASGLAFPLLWEATTRFSVLPPAASALAVVVFSMAGLLVSWRQRLRALAICLVIPALVTAFGLAMVTKALVPFTAALLALCLAAIWLATEVGWGVLQWPAATALAVLTAELVALASRSGGFPDSYRHLSVGSVLTLVLLLPLAAVASAVSRALVRKRAVGTFDVVFTATSLVVGVGGGARILHAQGSSTTWLGVAALAIAAGSYLVTLSPREGSTSPRSTSLFLGALGLILLLVGVSLVGPSGSRALAWSALAIATAAIGLHLDRLSLVFHSAVLLWAAALASRLPDAAMAAMAGSSPSPWQDAPWTSWLVTLAAAGAYLTASRGFRSPPRAWAWRLPHGAMALIAATGAAVLMVSVLLAVLPGALTASAAGLAACRTGVLAGAALALGAARSRLDLPELGWLALLVLAVGGLKLLVEDLRVGSPLSLFVGFALYGGALLMVARHGRHPQPPAPTSS